MRASCTIGAGRRLLRDSLDPSPRGPGDEGFRLRQAGGALLRTPTRSFLCNRLGGTNRAAPTDLGSDVRPGGVIYAAPVGLSHGVSLSSCSNATLAGVAPIPRHSSLLGRLGPSSHRLPQLRGLRHNIYDGRGLRRHVRRGTHSSLEGFGRRERGCILGDSPRAGNRGRKAEVSRIGGSIK